MKILLCNQSFPAALAQLEQRLPAHELLTCATSDVNAHIEDADVLISLGARLDAERIARGRFGLIHQFGVGLDGVDIEAATRAGVWVARAPADRTGNAGSVAEHALLLMLALARQLDQAGQHFARRQLGQPRGEALLGQRACIVGLGAVGVAVARRLNAFGMKLVGVHEYPEREVAPAAGIETVRPLSELRDALAGARWVVLCLNYHERHHHLVDARAFAAMSPGTSVINVARGGLLDAEALADALASGHIASAGLDVFDNEPADPNHRLFAENVLATPHIAGVTDVSYAGTAQIVADNIDRYARGEKPQYLANEPKFSRA